MSKKEFSAPRCSLRAHQQRAAFLHRMAERERGMNRSELAAMLRERAAEHQTDADVIERIPESRG
ncbi:hypothetical protein [Arvimicrobium flavum]|uniref:hypothetical protein n=1 Tax=Arvimicrobium flavum TaxID=3393320 RepID=UPI00237C0D24|nr:hypothetical protein [Mesorhizobium shangrilense]